MPVPVDSSLRFTTLAAANDMICGTAPSGRVWCWGDYGQPRGPRRVGIDVAIRQVGVDEPGEGLATVCGIGSDALAYCWGGANGIGQFGGTPSAPYAPVQVSPTLRFRDVRPSCGIATDDAIYCWGVPSDTLAFDVAGVLHDTCFVGGSAGHPRFAFACRYPPVRLRSAIHWTRFARGTTNCALADDQRAYCWSSAPSALFGGTTWPAGAFAGGRAPVPGDAPIALALPAPVRDLAALDAFAGCAIAGPASTVYCWGSSNLGRFGTGVSAVSAETPVIAAGGRAFVAIAGALTHTCALDAAGAAWCWGDGFWGELGNGAPAPECAPSIPCLSVPTRVVSIAKR